MAGILLWRPWLSLSSSQILYADQPFLPVRACPRLVCPQHVDLYYILYAEFVLSPIRLRRNANVSKICQVDDKDDWLGFDNCEQYFHVSCEKSRYLYICLSLIKSSDLVFTKSVDSSFRAFRLAPVTWNIPGYSLFCERREKWRVVSRKFQKKKCI